MKKKHGTVTNSFQTLKCFLLKEDDSIDRNHAMSYCCFKCFKNFVSYMMNLYCERLKKILCYKMLKQKNCSYSALVSVFCFVFLILIASCLLLIGKKKLFSHVNQQSHFGKYLYTMEMKKDNKKYEWYEHDLRTYFYDLKHKQLASNTDDYFKRAHVINFYKINHKCGGDPLKKIRQ